MKLDEEFLKKIISEHEKKPLKCILYFSKKDFLLEEVTISKISNPVSGPTSRGGIYLSGDYSYKIIGKISNVSLVPLLSKTMLGPNTKFEELRIKTELPIDGKLQQISLITHLTNTVQKSSKIELHLLIIRVEVI